MPTNKSKQTKAKLHVRNRNRERYDLDALKVSNPELIPFIKPNKYGDESVDFSDPEAVRTLNKALLNHYYDIKHWDFPAENLCPAIPGRAEYIHKVADLLGEYNFGNIPRGNDIICYDIGVGASCIYPIIGITEYDWQFIGSDIDPKSIESAQKIIEANPSLIGKATLVVQENPKDIFYGVIRREDKIDLAICNPPFHASVEEAESSAKRKVQNLLGKKVKKPTLNFAGVNHELIYDGGEIRFVHNLVKESKKYAKNCLWFSTLISKQSNLNKTYAALEKNNVAQVRTINMGTGNKASRIVAWSYLSKAEVKEWRETRWLKKPAKDEPEST